MAVLLGGRAAEYIFFHHLSRGAADDGEKPPIPRAAWCCATAWIRISATSPMSASARPCSARRCSRTSMAREFSDETERLMDHAIRGLIGRAFDRATGILNTHRAVHEKTAQVLLQQ